MFRSSSYHSIDTKGRIIIPSRFRDVINAEGQNGVMISCLDNALYAYTFSEWRNIEKKILANKSRHMVKFKRVFIGNACECLSDKQDRIRIPQNLRESVGLEKEIALVGLLDHFEIWSKENWIKENKLVNSDLEKDEVRDEIASIGL
ncbi:MAG: division/cell wall cluster transcriptional repressor MraZ [Desulfobacteraceae bacterium]|nr:division/cell wall cluster transcriptional repressor MraZ [Desulfobacteraceae bacterium]